MPPADRTSVAVVIPCFNQARFVSAAIESALGQTVALDEIIVVDDGSSDEIAAIAAGYPSIRLIRQENRGLAGARNTGLRHASSDKLIFLDADDRLFPRAVEAGLECARDHPDAAFVYGAFRSVKGHSRARAFSPVSTHRDLVKCNWIGMIATVMFDRVKLVEAAGFDESLGMCEDWDCYLRLSRRFPFAAHGATVADYVRHDSNASNDWVELGKWIDVVRAREWDRGLDADDRIAWRDGIRIWSSILEIKSTSSPVRAVRRAGRILRRMSGR